MNIPTVGSVVSVKFSNMMGPSMIPPGLDYIVFTGKVIQPYSWVSGRQFCISGNDNFPIRVIDLEFVLDIEWKSGTFTESTNDVQIIEVAGSKGKTYTVTKTAKSISCSCPGFSFRKSCKHIV